jgi:hypothetical protein
MENIAFYMSQIKIEQFAVLIDEIPEDLGVNVSFGVQICDDYKSVRMLAQIRYTQEDTVHLMLDMACIFSLSEESIKELIESNKIVLPRGFLVHMAIHTIGTARGVLHCKTEGKKVNILVLPPINVDSMFPEDLEFVME